MAMMSYVHEIQTLYNAVQVQYCDALFVTTDHGLLACRACDAAQLLSRSRLLPAFNTRAKASVEQGQGPEQKKAFTPRPRGKSRRHRVHFIG